MRWKGAQRNRGGGERKEPVENMEGEKVGESCVCVCVCAGGT